MLGESRVGGLVKHEVLSLDQDQIAQKGREEKGANHRHDQREIEQNLGHHGVSLYDNWQDAGLTRLSQRVFRNDHVDVYIEAKKS